MTITIQKTLEMFFFKRSHPLTIFFNTPFCFSMVVRLQIIPFFLFPLSGETKRRKLYHVFGQLSTGTLR
ncbi:hypothetical protein FOA26_12175 [Bacillus velezensis]|nr:hypothetical protein BVMH_14720 [Bacillus velezensis]AZJ43376.1 hypothetical protein EG882_08945 [Bacillus velezensis]MBW7977856.1 hypothetical protein [Bacillus velezensis]QCC37063.1 hypothetical protein E4T61_14085 [Bacillus velezensis]QCT30861.1 hypothetical protein D1120_13835 [Bacillus velezensis]